MRTAISESERVVLDHWIQHWMALSDAKEECLTQVSAMLGLDQEETLDVLNVCANSRAALDRLGVEVYDDYALRADEPVPLVEQYVRSERERIDEEMRVRPWDYALFAIAVLVAIICFALGL